MSRADWATVFKQTGRRFIADGCFGLAKQIAYSSLLAFFPAIVALVGLLDLAGAYALLQRFLDPVAPRAVVTLIRSFRADTGGSGSIVAVFVGLVGAVWAASGAMGSVVTAVNRAEERPETRPFWKVRLVALVLVAATVVVATGTLVLIVFGGTLGDAIAAKAHVGGPFTWTWDISRWPIAFVAVLLFFSLIYYLAPDVEHRRWRPLSAGAVLGALMWLALSGLLALYTSFSNSYTKTYGTLAGGIVLLLWLNYSAWAILFGAELNAELARRQR